MKRGNFLNIGIGSVENPAEICYGEFAVNEGGNPNGEPFVRAGYLIGVDNYSYSESVSRNYHV